MCTPQPEKKVAGQATNCIGKYSLRQLDSKLKSAAKTDHRGTIMQKKLGLRSPRGVTQVLTLHSTYSYGVRTITHRFQYLQYLLLYKYYSKNYIIEKESRFYGIFSSMLGQ